MPNCQKRKTSSDDLIRKPYPGVYNFREEEEIAYKKIKNELSLILQENVKKSDEVVWLSGTTLPKVEKTKTRNDFDDENEKLEFYNSCEEHNRVVEIAYNKIENEPCQILKQNVMKSDAEVVWLSGTTYPKVDKTKSIDDGNEKLQSDNSSFNHKILTFSDLCDEEYDFWGNSSTELRPDYSSIKSEVPASVISSEVQEVYEMLDFDFSKFVETHFETAKNNGDVEQATQLQIPTESNSSSNKLPSIASTYSLLQPYTNWLKTLTATNNETETNDASDFNVNSHIDAATSNRSMGNEGTNTVSRKTTESTAVESHDEKILRFNRWEDIPQEVRDLNRTLGEFHNTKESVSLVQSKTSIRDNEIKDFLLQDSKNGKASERLIHDVFSVLEDNLEDELIKKSVAKKYVQRVVRKKIISENASLVTSQGISLNENIICDARVSGERLNPIRVATGVQSYEGDVFKKPHFYESKRPRAVSPIGNSQFFVSDIVTSRSSIDTYNNQVIISSFDQVQDEPEPTVYPVRPLERKRNPTLASRNKKYEESISSLIQEAQQKLADAQVQNRYLNKTVVVGPSANGFGNKTQGPTASSENANFCQLDAVKGESNPLYLILPDNFDISSLQANNSNNQLFLVIDNTTQSDSKTYLASAAVGNSKFVLPQTSLANPTLSSCSQPIASSVPLQSTHNPEKSSLAELQTQTKFSTGNQKATSSISSAKALHENSLDSLFSSIYGGLNSSGVFSSSLESDKCKVLPQQTVTSNETSLTPSVLKNIALGKDKNAIRQTSVPLKMDNFIIDPSMPMFAESSQGKNKNDSFESGIDLNFSQSPCQEIAEEKPSNTSVTPLVNLYIPLSFFNNPTQNMIKTPVTVTSINSGTDSVVLKHSSSQPTPQPSINFTSAPVSNIIPSNAMPNETISSVSSSISAAPLNSMISLIPCLTSSPTPLTTIVPKTIVPRQHNVPMDDASSNNQCLGSKLTGKVKKAGRKTVRELLDEKYKKVLEQAMTYGRISRSTFDLRSNNNIGRSVRVRHSSVAKPVIAPKVVVKPSICFLSKDCSVPVQSGGDFKPRIRPNIMVLPSASKAATSQSFPVMTSTQACQEKWPGQNYIQTVVTEPTAEVTVLPPFKFGRVSAKDNRTRHFDLRCLQIGNFKVQDYFDNKGKIRSKVKIVFTKRQLLYEFPASRCNSNYPSASPATAQMFQISVPFKIIAAMDIDARSAIFRVNSAPNVYLGKVGRRKGVITCAKLINVATTNDGIFEDVQSYHIHKVILKKRQSSKLKTYLWNFDRRFHILSNISIHEKQQPSSNNLLPTFEDELELTDVRKLINKTRKGNLRRLPAWDSQTSAVEFQNSVKEGDELLKSAVHVCSCRISCKSVRCSCVKAAKSCNVGRSTCLCTDCDNPLSILKLLGINLEFALMDSCLFQNVYEIKDFEIYLRREIKLSCCNYVAKVYECVPGTVLCPNLECNVMIQYSWCRGAVCYPERNPSNHCSHCGWCCFSSGKHCLKCNKCYTTGPKLKSCPSCSESDEANLNITKDINEENSILKSDTSDLMTLEVSVQLQNGYEEHTCFEGMNGEENISLANGEISGQNRKETLQEYLSHTIFMPS